MRLEEAKSTYESVCVLARNVHDKNLTCFISAPFTIVLRCFDKELRSKAIAPATAGVATDVPDIVVQMPPSNDVPASVVPQMRMSGWK